MFSYKSNQPFLSYIAESLDICLHLFIFRLVFLHGGGGEKSKNKKMGGVATKLRL